MSFNATYNRLKLCTFILYKRCASAATAAAKTDSDALSRSEKASALKPFYTPIEETSVSILPKALRSITIDHFE